MHFCLLDILSDGPATVQECLEKITDEYLSAFDTEFPDEGTVRNKLKEYEKMGIVRAEKRGRILVYSLAEPFRQQPAWRDEPAWQTGLIGKRSSWELLPRPLPGHPAWQRLQKKAQVHRLLCFFLCLHPAAFAADPYGSRSRNLPYVLPD